ncbi:helix-turn-helix domain-containing protein [Kitasatospora acidiphila]|uniref:Helix-turn-helix domain-containing protein n=1 Tax=Kitasatospora acidiphila TaxID=2567942 RepID=A0A540WCX5_9ACTN|nr:helix-turn-helix domain-containing protein [Kitasatospora acidiphila]
MGRRQRDLDMSGGPVAEFAALLRAARESAGNPTFAAMSRRAHRSISALSEAAGGVEFPTWPTVEAFVHACGHSETAPWRERWEATQAAIAQAAAPDPAPQEPTPLPADPAPSQPPPSRHHHGLPRRAAGCRHRPRACGCWRPWRWGWPSASRWAPRCRATPPRARQPRPPPGRRRCPPS